MVAWIRHFHEVKNVSFVKTGPVQVSKETLPNISICWMSGWSFIQSTEKWAGNKSM